ncbi:hypothetical protein DID88_001294 [Monilinia fructigena]|uniref:LIM zinc-binding domain-containing protein n=1 Tax=Monilinia fructigena TaxID=38457 RepID=A0A395IZF3_9HELO|nr:hypothetical protein DID88_001294 [Monilinia fructigena]
MRLSDRSPKLPTPTAVSDRPGRPICEEDRRSIAGQIAKSKAYLLDQARRLSRQTKILVHRPNFPDTPHISVSAPSVPTIIEPGSPTKSAPAIPSINVPTINEPISQSTPQIPTISAPVVATKSKATPRSENCLNTLTHDKLRRLSLEATGSPAVGSRATATCHQCQLPIEGKVVALRGLPERFHPECFICFTCGTALQDLEISPEPAVSRAARLDRIKRRAQGEDIPDTEGETEAEDGDARLRFYCHLDWHELYAPRCKH